MKTFITLSALAMATQAPGALAWWDNGHQLVGQVATQLMSPADVATIHKLLSAWSDDFPNTDTIATAAIWPDLLKCSSANTTICPSPLAPSFSAMGDWHYIDLPLDVAGARWGGFTAEDLALFDYSIGGNAVDVLEKSLTTMNTAKSSWSANLIVRNFIHIFSDLHQPLHAVAGTRADLPSGHDGGGNAFKFASPCAFSNLHGLWDAAGGVYSLNNWSPDVSVTNGYLPSLQANATSLIKLLPIVEDKVSFDAYKDLSYSSFVSKMSSDKALRKVVLDSYGIASEVMYNGLDLKFTGSTVPCPPQWYQEWAGQISQFRIALGGKRLAVVLTQFAKQIRTKLGYA